MCHPTGRPPPYAWSDVIIHSGALGALARGGSLLAAAAGVQAGVVAGGCNLGPGFESPGNRALVEELRAISISCLLAAR